MLRLYVECMSRDAGSSDERAQPRAATVHERKRTQDLVTGKSACATRVNKADSPRISEDIHIDRKQPLGVSLKGSPLALLGAGGSFGFRPEGDSGDRIGQVSRSSRVSLGYLKSAAQAECYRVFDKKVERASREIKRGLWPE